MIVKAGRKKRIKGPGDKFVDIPIVEEAQFSHSKGAIFHRRKYKFINDDKEHPTTRKVKAKTITHRAIGVNGGPPDSGDDQDRPQDTVQVEVIQEITTKTGSGPTYNKYISKLTHDPPENPEPGRKTHTVRIRNPAHSHWWVDVERTLEYTTKTGTGPTFKRYIHKIDWDHDSFNNVSALPLDDDPDTGFDPPWRLDPYQNIVNVRWTNDDDDDHGGGSPRYAYYIDVNASNGEQTPGTCLFPDPDLGPLPFDNAQVYQHYDIAAGSPSGVQEFTAITGYPPAGGAGGGATKSGRMTGIPYDSAHTDTDNYTTGAITGLNCSGTRVGAQVLQMDGNPQCYEFLGNGALNWFAPAPGGSIELISIDLECSGMVFTVPASPGNPEEVFTVVDAFATEISRTYAVITVVFQRS